MKPFIVEEGRGDGRKEVMCSQLSTPAAVYLREVWAKKTSAIRRAA